MEELVIMHDQQAVTTSLKVAEVFEKEHKDVMKSIRNLTAQNCAVLKMFVEDKYINSQNKQQPMYYMNRDGFTLLAMGFTGSKAMEFKLKYIEAFVISRYEDLRKENFDKAIDFIDNWYPPCVLSREIETINSQKNLF